VIGDVVNVAQRLGRLTRTLDTDVVLSCDIMEASTLDERLGALELLGAVLQNQPEVAAIQVGYGNGDYFIIRSISSEKVRKLFQARDNSTYVVDNITTDPTGNQKMLYRSYYDESLQKIGHQQPEITEYDPRARPWYKKAMGTSQVAASEPYFFFFLKSTFTTFSLFSSVSASDDPSSLSSISTGS